MSAHDASCDRWYSLRNALQLAMVECARYVGCMNPSLRSQLDIDNELARDNLMEMYPVPGTTGPAGADGKSAYDLAVLAGYVGYMAAWLASLNGAKGDTGAKGDKGDKGDKADAPKVDNMENRLTVNVGAEVRWMDFKHFAFASGYRYDINHKGHTVDAMVIQVKLGKSYEEKQLEALKSQVRTLQLIAARGR